MTASLLRTEDFETGMKVRWEWYREGFLFRTIDPALQPFGVVQRAEDEDDWDIRLVDDEHTVIRVSDMLEEGYIFWRASGLLDIEHRDGTRGDLVDQLYGLDGEEVDDGAAAAMRTTEEPDSYVRDRVTRYAAAQRIELLESLLLDLAQDHELLLERFRDQLGEEQWKSYAGGLEASRAAIRGSGR